EWVSTGGSLVSGFEEEIARYVNMPRAVACNSGTSGLHLALLVAGVKKDEEVIVPTLTFIAAVNPVRYCGAEPVFIGCDDSLCMSPVYLENFCSTECEMKLGKLFNKKTHREIKAVIIVHVFGNLADMESIMETAKKYNLKVIEDATEALGSYFETGKYKGKMAGTIGDVGVYSFNGNKIITTGAGGMLVSNHEDWAEHAKYLSTQAKDDLVQFIHGEVGYNYRLTNLQAALGLAQLEQLENFIEHKHEIYNFYKENLDGKAGIKVLGFRKDTRSNCWFYSLYLGKYALSRNELINYLTQHKIQSRPVWALIHEQKPYVNSQKYKTEKAEDYRAHIVNIPCSTNLTLDDAKRVIDTILAKVHP
ncbi:MAG: LegC family aminotransferase, partial [Oscillospiraceae bacterium]